MKELNEDEKVSLLVEILEKELVPIQAWAIKELEKIKNKKVIAELKKALKIKSSHIRKIAKKSLERMGVEVD